MLNYQRERCGATINVELPNKAASRILKLSYIDDGEKYFKEKAKIKYRYLKTTRVLWVSSLHEYMPMVRSTCMSNQLCNHEGENYHLDPEW